MLGRGSRQVGLCGPERRAGALLWTREAPTPHVCRTGAHLQKAGPALTLTRRLTPQLFNIYPWLGALLQLHRPVLRKIAEVRGILRPLLEARRASAARGGPAHSYVDALIQQGQVWARHIPPAAPQRPQRPGPTPGGLQLVLAHSCPPSGWEASLSLGPFACEMGFSCACLGRWLAGRREPRAQWGSAGPSSQVCLPPFSEPKLVGAADPQLPLSPAPPASAGSRPRWPVH